MGIKGFYSWLIERYPLIVKNFRDISRPIVNNLYIDFNQLLFNGKSMCNFNFPDKLQDYLLVTNEILRFLDTIIQLVRPTTLLFIAIDGTPPYNKIYNQYPDKVLNLLDDFTDNNKKEDVNFIPGCQFMIYFQEELQNFIQEKTKNDAAWQTPQVIYSSVNNPGETEHKIFEFIRERSKILTNQQNQEVHCIFSNVADIIPLIMLTPENNFLLMRWVAKRNDKALRYWLSEADFELVYVNILREYLIQNYDINNLKNIYQDWVFLISLVGNDFFKGFSYFYIINVDPKMSRKKKEFNIFFSSEKFIKLMNLYEEKILLKKKSLIKDKFVFKKHDYVKKTVIDLNNFAILLKAFLDDSEINEKVDVDNFNDEVSFECQKLLDNLHWLLMYYLDKCPSWSYYYSCDLKERETKQNANDLHPLTFSDLYLFIIKNMNYQPISFDDDTSVPLTPFEGILARFPRWNNSLPDIVKEKVHTLLNDFKNSSGKTVLNRFSYNQVRKIISELSEHFTNRELKLNMSIDEYYIIEGGEVIPKALQFISTKSPPVKIWIPSLNKITQFLIKPQNDNLLYPFNINYNDDDINLLKNETINKIRLVDYPFLKPIFVKDIIWENPSNIPIKGIKILSPEDDMLDEKDKKILTIVGYPLVISSTDHSSLVVCGELEKFPFSLSVQLVPKLITVLDNLNHSISRIQKEHKIIVLDEQDFYFQTGIIKDFSDENVCVQLINSKSEPDLDEFFESEILLVKEGPFTIIANEDLNRLEEILDNTDFDEYDSDIDNDELLIEKDDLIWEGKPIVKEQYVQIGDRVISVTHGGPVEFGTFGTVVGYNYRYEEVYVVLDVPVKFGCCFYGQLKTTRGIIGKTYDFFIINKNIKIQEKTITKKVRERKIVVQPKKKEKKEEELSLSLFQLFD